MLNFSKNEVISLKVHKFAEKYPLADDDEFAVLKESIRTNGVQVPIMIYEGQILDGRNRHRAIVELYNEGWNGSVSFGEYSGDNPEQYADNLNLCRRHLSAQQKAILAVKYHEAEYEQFKAQAAKNKKSGKNLAQNSAQGGRNLSAAQMLGALVGVNHDYINKIEQVKNTLPQLVDFVYEKKLDIQDAYSLVRMKDEQIGLRDKILEQIRKGRYDVKALRTELKPKKDNVDAAKIPGNLGIFFSFNITPSVMDKIKDLLFNEGYYEQDYEIWVGQDDKTRQSIESLKDSLKIKVH